MTFYFRQRLLCMSFFGDCPRPLPLNPAFLRVILTWKILCAEKLISSPSTCMKGTKVRSDLC